MTITRTHASPDTEAQSGDTKKLRNLRDFGVLAVLGVIFFIVSCVAGLWPRVLQAAARSPQWHPGDLVVALALLAVPLILFLGLRCCELDRRARDRKVLEEKLVQKTRELESVFKTFPDLYVRLDSDGTVLDYQAGRLSDLYVEPKTLLGRRMEDVLPAGVSRQFHEAIIQVNKTNAAVIVEYSLPRKEGRRTFEVRFLPFERKQIIAIFRDVTERTQANKRLQCYAEELSISNEELKIFAYIVSHDLRSPLVNIKGFASELELSVDELGRLLAPHADALSEEERTKLSGLLEKEIPEALAFIGSSVKRMDNLTNAILKLSRLGRRDLRLERIDTASLVQSMVKSLGHQIGSGEVTVSVGPLPVMTADATAMEQIFGNLLDNAIKYLEPGRPGIIEISAEECPGEIVFRVKDNGRGVSPDDAAKVFEIFRRVGRQDVAGEGMGLAYVRTLVRRHGGRIWCEAGQGIGTVFAFTVPAGGTQASGSSDATAPVPPERQGSADACGNASFTAAGATR